LKVVPNPTLKLKVVCDYPSYIERGPLTIDPVSPAVPVRVPVGSHLTITARADKPLEKAQIDGPAAESKTDGPWQFAGAELGDERREFTCELKRFPALAANEAGGDGKGAGDKTVPASSQEVKSPREYTLQFNLRDTDGLKMRDPFVLTLVAVPDEPPEVKVRLVGTREPVLTPRGRLPAVGTITDDWGLARVWWDYKVAERAAAAAPKTPSDDPDDSTKPAEPPAQRSGKAPLVKVHSPPAARTEGEGSKVPKDVAEDAKVPKDAAEYTELPNHLPEYIVKEKDAYVEASDLGLTTGQSLTVTVKAEDLCTEGSGPNIGSGETWQLDVVTVDELLTRLEAQELLVKQRFEAIVEEMAETRTLLLRMDFTPPGTEKPVAPKDRPAGALPGDTTPEMPNFTAKELSDRRLERTLQALQNCRKNAAETADVIAAIDEIRLQLDNNQIDDEAHKRRIEKQVLQPLHDVVEVMFPVLDKDLVDLKEVVADLTAGPKGRDAARKQADQILAKMLQVLKNMMTAEDFDKNVLQRLREIIKRQQELTHQTESKEQQSLGDKE